MSEPHEEQLQTLPWTFNELEYKGNSCIGIVERESNTPLFVLGTKETDPNEQYESLFDLVHDGYTLKAINKKEKDCHVGKLLCPECEFEPISILMELASTVRPSEALH